MVRMQGLWMAGERRPVYPAWIHWSGGDNGLMSGSNETPALGGVVGGQAVAGEAGQVIGCTVTSSLVSVTR